MKIYRLSWEEYDWNAYYGAGYNFIKAYGIVYATTKDKAIANCPITDREGKIEITGIEVLE